MIVLECTAVPRINQTQNKSNVIFFEVFGSINLPTLIINITVIPVKCCNTKAKCGMFADWHG